MRVARPHIGCPLCAPQLEGATHDAIVAAARRGGRIAGLAEAAREELSLSDAELKAHLQYHRPGQSAARGRLIPERALALADLLPRRLQGILDLVGRVPGLSGSQLAELYYWTGEPDQIASARAACYRDLARLTGAGFLWRHYPRRLIGPSGSTLRARQHRLSFYFLGREAVPFVEARSGRTLERGRDWIGAPDEVPLEFALFPRHARSSVLSNLAADTKRLAVGDTPLRLGASTVRLSFVTDAWFDGELVRLAQRDKSVHEPAALAAFSVGVKGREEDVLVPFLVELDDGVGEASRFAEHLLDWHALKQAGALGRRVPALKAAGSPPVLCLTTDARRLEAVRRAAQQIAHRRVLTGELPLVALAEQASFASDPLRQPIWVSLWDTDMPPRGRPLADILAVQAEASAKAGLTTDTRLQLR